MGRTRNLKTNTTFKDKEYNFSSPIERDAFLAAANAADPNSYNTISQGNGASYERKGNKYIKVVAEGNMGAGVIVYQTGWDAATGLPLVSDTAATVAASSFPDTPMGMVDALGGTSSSSIKAGDTFDLCIWGVVPNAFIYINDTTGVKPAIGSTLETDPDVGIILGEGTGSGTPVATLMDYQGTTTDTQGWNSTVFMSSALTDSFLRPTIDGVFSQQTTRIPAGAVFANPIAKGDLVVSANINDPSSFGADFLIRCRPYVSSTDSVADIVGIAVQAMTDITATKRGSVCVNGLVGGITVYDNSGAAHIANDVITGFIVYAGDGTTNSEERITTDPTSGIPIGMIHSETRNNDGTFVILFQPGRLYA